MSTYHERPTLARRFAALKTRDAVASRTGRFGVRARRSAFKESARFKLAAFPLAGIERFAYHTNRFQSDGQDDLQPGFSRRHPMRVAVEIVYDSDTRQWCVARMAPPWVASCARTLTEAKRKFSEAFQAYFETSSIASRRSRDHKRRVARVAIA
jgi:hypothetical protein